MHDKVASRIRGKTQKAKSILDHYKALAKDGVSEGQVKYERGEKLLKKWEKQGNALLRKLERL